MSQNKSKEYCCENELNSKLDKGCPERNDGLKKCCAVRIGGGGEVSIGNVEEEGCPKISPKEYC